MGLWSGATPGISERPCAKIDEKDSLGLQPIHCVEEFNIPTLIFKPDYKKYGKSAPFVRNKLIIEHCDIVIAFWDGQSNGTKDSLNHAKKLNKQIFIVNFTPTT